MTIIVNELAVDASNEILLTNLYKLLDILEAMQQIVNALQENETGTQQTFSGGNLFQIASYIYGDATMWNFIAQANIEALNDTNGFINPNLSGIIQLNISPAPTSSNGGIFNV
jgi:hypothetical protein